MKLKVFSIYDSKTECFMNPWYARTTGEAVRSFEQSIIDPNTSFHKYPDDFTLFDIGSWDDETGEILLNEAKVNIGLAREFFREDNKPDSVRTA